MPALSLSFHVHRPYCLRPFSFFEIGKSAEYFDVSLTERVLEQTASRVYLPIQAALESLLKRYGQEFQCAFFISGTAIEQMQEFVPSALAGFRRLAGNPSVEILGSTYYHSLAALVASPEEFLAQAVLHREILLKELGVVPTTFFCPAQLYSNGVAELLPQLGFSGVILDQVSGIIHAHMGYGVYRTPSTDVRIAASVSSRGGDIESMRAAETADPGAFMNKLREMARKEDDYFCVRVGCDAVSSGDAKSEVVVFLKEFVEVVLGTPGWRFVTPSQGLRSAVSPQVLVKTRQEALEQSEASEGGLLRNSMQRKAFRELYQEALVSQADRQLWRRLQCADHFQHMCVQEGVSPKTRRALTGFESPYDTFIAYMNILRAVSHGVAKE